jgi:hypothetical protein
MQQRSSLLFGLDREAPIGGRYVVSPEVQRPMQYLLELLVGKPKHLPLGVSDAMYSLSQSSE